MDRSVLAGIGASVALAVGCVGMFVLTPGHHTDTAAGRTDSAALAGNQPPPTLPSTPEPSSSHKPSPSPSHKPHKHHAKSPPPSPHKLPQVASGNVFVGVAVKSGIVSGVQSFSNATGAHISMVEIYSSFGAPFPATGAHRIISTGATPLIQWNPRVRLAKIVSGGFDTYLHNFATAVKRFGHPVTLSFGHEMNGPWSQWGAGHVSPATFVKAWRRIHNIFAGQGVQNVSWSWDPSHTGELPRPWWPGPRYVDKIGIDGYLRPGQTFADIFADRLGYIRGFASEPVFIAETSVAPSSDQGRQVVELFNGVVRYHLSGFVWFNINHLEDWRLEGRPAAIRAFRSAVNQTNNG